MIALESELGIGPSRMPQDRPDSWVDEPQITEAPSQTKLMPIKEPGRLPTCKGKSIRTRCWELPLCLWHLHIAELG